jgi:hypothetical protein
MFEAHDRLIGYQLLARRVLPGDFASTKMAIVKFLTRYEGNHQTEF